MSISIAEIAARLRDPPKVDIRDLVIAEGAAWIFRSDGTSYVSYCPSHEKQDGSIICWIWLVQPEVNRT